MRQRDEEKIQDPVPLVTKHLNAVRGTIEYKLLLEAVARAGGARGSRPEENLSLAADAVLRPIARDLSFCCKGNRVIIFHMMVVNNIEA